MSTAIAYFVALAKETGFSSPASRLPSSSVTSTTPASEGKQRIQRGALRSTDRSSKSLNKKDVNKSLGTLALHKVKESNVRKPKSSNRKEKRKSVWNFSRLSSFFGIEQQEEKKESDENEESEDGLEGDTMVQDHHDAEVDKSWESKGGFESDIVGQYEEDEENEKNDISEDELNGDTMIDHDNSLPPTEDEVKSSIIEDKKATVPVRRRIQPMQSEYNLRNLDPNDPRIARWTKDEIWLFNKLANRGREPLFHYQLLMHFPAFPDILFTGDPGKVFFNSHHASQTHLVHAIINLVNAASWLRDCLNTPGRGPPERPLYLQIRAMRKWALMDGQFQFKAHIPVVAIAAATTKDETIHGVVDRITERLHKFGRQYRDKWRHPDSREGDTDEKFTHELPTLYGIVIKHSVSAVVTYDASVPDKPIRTLLTCNWATSGQEVWYTLAIAIVMARARNYLMQLDEEGELGPLIVDQGPDPDA